MNGPASPGNAGPPPESSGDASQPSVSRVESTKLMIDRAMGGDRHDRQLTTALLAVMVALLILIPLGSIALVLIGLGPYPDGWAGAEPTRFGRLARRLWDPILAAPRRPVG